MADQKKKNKRGGRRRRREKPEFDNKLLDLARVTRVVKGGRRFRFRATVVLGNRKGKVGVGISKGTDVQQAIQKASDDAQKHMITVPMDGSTIPHDVKTKHGSAIILLKPAPEGSGIIAGGAVRSVLDLAGVRDVVSKSLGTSSKINVARATIVALSELSQVKVKTPKKTDEKPVAKKETKETPKKITPKKEMKETQKKVTPKKEVKVAPKKATKKTTKKATATAKK